LLNFLRCCESSQDLQIAAEIEHLQENKPNLISKVQNNLVPLIIHTNFIGVRQDSWYRLAMEKLRSRI